MNNQLQSGQVPPPPERWPDSGERIRVWVNQDLRSALRDYADARELSMAQAVNHILHLWHRRH